MEGSTGKTPPHSGVNDSNGDKLCEEITISFGRLREVGTQMSQPSMMQSKNTVSSSSDNSLDVKESVTNNTDKLSATQVTREEEGCSSKGIGSDELPASIDKERPPTSSVLQENIRARPNLYNERAMTLAENHYSGQERPISSSMNYTDNDLNHLPANSCEVPQSFRLPQGIDFLMTARSDDGSKWLQDVIKQGNFPIVQSVLNRALGLIFQLMIDDKGRHVFGTLVENCNRDQLKSIVQKAQSEPDTFITIAFIHNGSLSIQRLIKRLKTFPMVQIITGIISRRSYDLLTDKIGSQIIRQCFTILGEEQNQKIYEAISNQLLALATHPMGCISLNHCVGSIAGPRRTVFLERLAAHSLFLSNNTSGSFVVQRLLDLHNQHVTEKVLYHLQGNLFMLAQKRGGSYIVEKCMTSSQLGLRLVVTEILKDEQALLQLAHDEFGNYVIQTALKETKIKNQELYQELLKALRPHGRYLSGKRTSRNIFELIREDLEFQKADSDE